MVRGLDKLITITDDQSNERRGITGNGQCKGPGSGECMSRYSLNNCIHLQLKIVVMWATKNIHLNIIVMYLSEIQFHKII